MMSGIIATFLRDLGTFFYLVPISASYGSSLQAVPDYVAAAIPYFFLLIFLELFYGLYKGYKLYTVKDTLMSLSLGMTQQLLELWAKEISLKYYVMLYEATQPTRLALFPFLRVFAEEEGELHASLLVQVPLFLASFLAVDFAYYWFHRCTHEYHFLWISHSVHHSGERYNLATALRQGGTQFLAAWVFSLPFAVLGVPPTHYCRHSRISLLYGFWVHTECVGRLPWWFEMVFNTPSHHRLHHRPPGNCNYAGTLIVWDRLFGTFVSECDFLLHEREKTEEADAKQQGTTEKKEEKEQEGITHHSADDQKKTQEESTETNAAESVKDEAQNNKKKSILDEDYPRGVIYGLARPLDSFDPVHANIVHLLRLWESETAKNKTRTSSSFLHRAFGCVQSLFRKRAHHPLRVTLNCREILADVVWDRNYAQEVREKEPSLSRWQLVWRRLWRLPHRVDETALLSSPVDDAQQREMTRKNYLFLQGRKQRESPDLSVTQLVCVFAHFALSTAAVLYMLLFSDKDPLFQGPQGTLFKAIATGLCVLSLCLVKKHY